MMVVAPLIIGAGFVIYVTVARFVHAPKQLKAIKQHAIKRFLVFLYCVFPMCCSYVCSTFNCEVRVIYALTAHCRTQLTTSS